VTSGRRIPYDGSMRYAQCGGYTPAEQERRERLRLQAAGRIARGDGVNEIARDLRVTPGSVRRWHRAWRDGGPEALRSKGPVSRERLSPQQWTRLEAELGKGPLAHGFAGDQRWTLARIKTLIGKLFHVGYTIEGTWKLMRRHGWSAQVPVRQAMERDDAAVAVWKAEARESGRCSSGPWPTSPPPIWTAWSASSSAS
jgi:transposase